MDTQQQLPFQRRDEFDQELYLRPFSSNGRAFLRIMFSAANGTPAAGVEGHHLKQRSQYIMAAEQSVLAELMHCSDRTVRRTVEELEGLGILKRYRPVVEIDGKRHQMLSYVLCLRRLIDLPCIDINTPIGRTVVDLIDLDVFEGDDTAAETTVQQVREESPRIEQSTGSEPVSGDLSTDLSGGLSTDLSAPSKTPVPVLRSCPAPQNSSSLSPDSCSGAQDAQEGVRLNFELQEGPCRRFDDIPPEHVRAIAGFSPGGKRISDLARVHVFLQYFRDAVKADFAKPEEVQLMLAIFRACGQRMSPDTAEAKRIRDPMNWIRSVWNARHQRPPLKNATIAKAMVYAVNLLKLAEETPAEPQLAEAT
ncbi:MAG: hypothetical protein Fues2KO_45550 [Fuerstiella sp.]